MLREMLIHNVSKKVAIISDSHICADRDKVYHNINMFDQLKFACTEINSSDAEIVIVAGDCANDKTLNSYKVFLESMSILNIPYCLTGGNHDSFKSIPHKVNLEHATIFVLDSSSGIMRLVNLKTNKPCVVISHHHLHGEKTNRHPIMKNSSNVLEHLNYWKTGLYIHGHIHCLGVNRQRRMTEVSLPPTSYVFKESDPIGWTMVEFQKEKTVLEFNLIDGSCLYEEVVW